MIYSSISASLDQDQLSSVLMQIQDLKTSLPFLIGLSKDQKRKLRKMGDNRTSFVHDIKTVALANTSAIPSNINLSELSKYIDLVMQLDTVIAEIRPLYNSLLDTNMYIGNEAMKLADVCYGHLKYASRNNPELSQTVKVLSQRFKHSKTSQNSNTVQSNTIEAILKRS